MDLSRATTPPENHRERLPRPASRGPHQLPPNQVPDRSGFGYEGRQGWSHPHVPSFNVLTGFDKSLSDQAQDGEFQREPFLPRSEGDVGVGLREGASATKIPIKRKPVATYTIVEDTQPPSSISETTEKPVETHALKPLWRVWTPELACILLSFLLFTAIIVVLMKFDQQTLPDWPLGITLNSFLALFATLAKAAFIFPVSMSISQIQWLWFNQDTPRSLYDFHIIDQASRGVWGSMILLWRFRFRHFVVLGALLIAISTLTTPIMQLTINYPSKDIAVAGEASTHAIRHLGAPRDWLYMVSRKAVFTSTFLDFSQFNETLPYSAVSPGGVSCSSGNCTFDPYQSLGVCMKMANISSYLRVDKLETPNMTEASLLHEPINGTQMWRVSLPGGYEMAHQSNLTLFTDMLNGNHSFGFQHDSIQTTRLASFVLIYTTAITYNEIQWKEEDGIPYEEIVANLHDFRHHAVEAFFYLCPHTCETEVHMGVENTRVVDSLAEPPEKDEDSRPFLDIDCDSLTSSASYFCDNRQTRWNETLNLKAQNKNSTTAAPPDSTGGEIFSADYRSMEDLAAGLRTQMAGWAAVLPRPGGDLSILARGGQFIIALHNFVVWNPTDPFDSGLVKSRLTNIYTNVATSLSATVRFNEPGRLSHGVSNITGQVWKDVTYVRITWGWFSLLAVELSTAALFLALTIYSQDRNRRLDREDSFLDVKGSSLAPLVALSEDCHAAAGGRLRPGDELEGIAKNLKVRFERGQIVPITGVDRKAS